MSMREPLFKLLRQPEPAPLGGKHVLVLGLGESGLSVARWLARQGSRVRVADSRAQPPQAAALAAEHPAIELRCGAFDPRLLEGIELLCVSPGISLEEPLVREAFARAMPILGDIELFAWRVRADAGSKVLAITGTNGKTTVTALTGHLLRAAGVDCEVAGNIGPAALDALMRRAGKPPRAWVLELSSYQLETTWSLAPDAAVLLNLSEDHLDRYASMADYAAAKARIFSGARLQLVNRDDPPSAALASPAARASFGVDAPPRPQDWGLSRAGGEQWLVRGAERILPVSELPLAGTHNIANALAACALASALDSTLGVRPETLAAGLRSFRGLPHRLERIAERRGVAWYDDSKGTNVGATLSALRGIAPRDGSGRVVLIAGGEGKGQDFTPLAAPARESARGVLLIGRDAPLIERALAASAVPVERCESLEAAVARAAVLARPGDVVLLSPACASFDMFRDYKHRGEAFAAALQALGG
jgi:UDP-N-acetylmuramoylalanine--D-glutamate ligase